MCAPSDLQSRVLASAALCASLLFSSPSANAWSCNCHSGPAGETCYSPCSWEMPGHGSGPIYPPGAVICGDGRYCNPGSYCGRSGGCVPNGSIDCGSFTCTADKICGSRTCLPAGATECPTSGYCERGNYCSSNGRYCFPSGSL